MGNTKHAGWVLLVLSLVYPSAWAQSPVCLAPGGGLPLSGWVNVADENARPNDGRDDTQALQEAIKTYLHDPNDNGIKVLWFPAGTYEISDTLFMEDARGAHLVGEMVGNPPRPGVTV